LPLPVLGGVLFRPLANLLFHAIRYCHRVVSVKMAASRVPARR
jgi:hypothetical protein